MLEVVKVPAIDLEVGMYVSSLDRPWLETPFVLQGFVLETRGDIERLQRYCQYVYVDTLKSVQAPVLAKRRANSRPRRPTQDFFPKRTLSKYEDKSSWTDEYPRAQKAVEVLSTEIDEMFDGVADGAAIDMVKAKKSVDPMIESITRNPDACIWLARMKQEDHYTYQHSLGASIWAVALGRQLGLPKADLRTLAIGGLLFDVGKLRVDKALLNATRPLTEEEFQQVRDHVRHGVEMIQDSGIINQDVIDMIAHHHERHDGSGYPQGLRGDGIPVFARIAAIVDCYDAITSNRSYARGIPPARAIKLLYEWKDCDFQAELVEEFIQAIGIYPAGSLVELSSGEVAVVIAEYRTRRLRPKVLVLLDADKAPMDTFKMVDLLTETHTEDRVALDIVNSLEPDAYGIDMTAIQL
ncbi:MAG: HD-GYP domain-containing protein [Gammaproteobacteria bacterium]|nr:HD-GYP domain-containing protein [Gammaproteobacteria bacterium]